MRAFILDRYGSADRVRAGDMPDPESREDDVLIQIHAAGVNPVGSTIGNGEFKSGLPLRSTKEAMAYVEAGRAMGKVIVSVRES